MRLTADTLPAAVKEHLPSRWTLSIPAQGETSDVVIATGEYESVVLKRSQGDVYAPWTEREARVLRALEGSSVAVPRVVDCICENEPGHPPVVWLITSYVPGRSVWDTLLGVAPSQRLDLLKAVGATLAAIHSMPAVEGLDDRRGTPWLDRHRTALELLKDSEDCLLEQVAASEVQCFIHGDFTLDNVLCTGNQVTGVIDWGGAGWGDPRFDITLALATEPEMPFSASEVGAFLDGYVSAPLPEALKTLVTASYRP